MVTKQEVSAEPKSAASLCWPSIGVMGAGAVGCYFGGMLARAGVRVTLIGRSHHVEAITADGLWIESPAFREFVPVSASIDPASLKDAELVIFAVKTVDTDRAASAMAPHLSREATVISLQNGVDNARRIQSHTTRPVIPAVVYVSAEMSGPGRVLHNGRGDLVIGASRNESTTASLSGIAELFRRADVPCRISENIESDLWTKLAINCAYNAVSALAHARYGRIVSHEFAHWVMQRAVVEATAVARADGVDLIAADLISAADNLAESVPQALSSTAQDLLLGKRTEIDDLNGYVVRRGAILGVPTPINQTLHALVKLLEDIQA